MDQEFPPITEQNIVPEDVDDNVGQDNQYCFFMERLRIAGDDNEIDSDLEEEVAFHNEDLSNVSITSSDYDETMDEPSPSSEPVASISSASSSQLPNLNNTYRPSPSGRKRLPDL